MDPILGVVERDRAPLILRRELIGIHQTPRTGNTAPNKLSRFALQISEPKPPRVQEKERSNQEPH